MFSNNSLREPTSFILNKMEIGSPNKLQELFNRPARVEPPTPRGSVAVHRGYDGPEGLPVYEAVCSGEPVAVLPDVLVGLSEHVGSESDHVCLWGMVIYKFNRGGVEDAETRGTSKFS